MSIYPLAMRNWLSHWLGRWVKDHPGGQQVLRDSDVGNCQTLEEALEKDRWSFMKSHPQWAQEMRHQYFYGQLAKRGGKDLSLKPMVGKIRGFTYKHSKELVPILNGLALLGLAFYFTIRYPAFLTLPMVQMLMTWWFGLSIMVGMLIYYAR